MTLGEYIAQKVKEALEEAIAESKGEFEDVAKVGGDAAAGGLLGQVTSVVDTLTNIIGAIPIIGSLIDLPLEPLKEAEKGAGKFGLAFGHGYLLGYAAYQFAHPIFLPIIHEVNANTTNEIFDPDTAAQLASQRIITVDFAHSESSGGGLDNPHQDQLIESKYNYPAFTETLQMLNRGIIQPQDAVTILQRDGVPQQYIDQVLALRHEVLSPADLALAVLRRTMTIDEANVFAEQAGYSADQMNTILLNTGEPPGTMQLLEAYRRDFIDQATLEHGILQSRVRDEWIPVIEKLRYSPMTVADAVRATVEKYITPEEGGVIAQQNGLLPEHWPIMVESWGRPLAIGEMLRLMHLGLVTEDQVKQAIRESDIKDKYVDIAMGLGRRLIDERLIAEMVQEQVMTRAQAVTHLMENGYTEQDANFLVDYGTAKHIGTHHTLSQTDTVAMYSDALINRTQALGYLEKLGFPADTAGQILDLADYKRKAALVKVTMRGIEAELKAQRITRNQAVEQLVAAGLDHSQAELYASEWEQLKRVATRTLTESQIIKAILAAIITVDDGRTRLAGLGLNNTDIDVLFQLEGVEKVKPVTSGGAPGLIT